MITPKNLLIVRADRIGDVVLSLPMAGIVKKAFPGCKVTFLLRDYTKNLAENNPDIDDVLVLKEEGGKIKFFDNISMISKFRFDTAIVVSPSFKTAFLISLSGINFRIGTGYRWYSFLFTHKIFEHRKYGEKHELEYNAGMLGPIGIKENITFENVRFNLCAAESSKQVIESVCKENNIQKDKQPVIIIHPGSGGSSIDWPTTGFKKLIELLLNESNAIIMLTGSESEKPICEELSISERVYNFAGRFDLRELIALIDVCDIFISNSTGPIHIAAALGKYTVGFYPKIPACSPERWGPYTAKRTIFTPVIECSGCTREQCEKLNCMESIKPEAVLAEIKKTLNTIVKNGEINV